MKVFWVENEKGEVYGNARWYTKSGPPKLYGSEKKLRSSLASPKSWGGDGWTLAENLTVCSGRLIKEETHD